MTEISRRNFLGTVSGAGLAFAFRDIKMPAKGLKIDKRRNGKPDVDHQICAATDNDTDYSRWLVFGNDGVVHAYTNRTELGQGLRTVMICLLSQAMNVSTSKVDVVLADTGRCPDDGATNGSSATSRVAWMFWLACEKIVPTVKTIGADSLGLNSEQVKLEDGYVISKKDPGVRVAVSELGNGKVIKLDLDEVAAASGKKYVDKGFRNVLGLEIVTGSIKFTGDLEINKSMYGAFQSTPYYRQLTKLKKADFSKTLQVPGVIKAGVFDGKPAILGESFTAVQEGIKQLKTRWKKPPRSRDLDYDEEIRANAEYYVTREEQGNLDAGFKQSSKIISETYKTHCIQTCPMETDTAIARVRKKKTKIWGSTQYPFKARWLTARETGVDEKDIRVIGCHVGGGFGGKIDNVICAEAAQLSQFAGGKPVKYVYSRKDQFTRESRAKETVLIDMTSGIDNAGNMIARKTDIFQDEGYGTAHVYDIPNCLTNLHIAKMPLRHATIRGTSYMQSVFAMESHTDELAHSIGMDPYDLRVKNLFKHEVEELMQEAAINIGYGESENTMESSTGMALVNHGATELGALFVNISIDEKTGKITVNKVSGAFDFGTVINKHTAMAGVKGAIIWGLGFAIHEEILHDGWGFKTERMNDYHIPRFSDTPPEMDIKFMQPYPVYGPRGCGEMPAPPVAPAIANAFRNATGIRLYETPFSPDRILETLKS